MPGIRAVVFDMAGTTVEDRGEVTACFLEAAQQTSLGASREKILSMMGMSKRQVFEALWTEQLSADSPAIQSRTDTSYDAFRSILEDHYLKKPVRATEGCDEAFQWLREHHIAVALTTGFYRKVTDIILERLGWDRGLDENHVGTEGSVIQVSVASDDVENGRPQPDMIRLCMRHLRIQKPEAVVKVGDTPVDLLAGRNADCLLSLGVTNGTHSEQQLAKCPNDGLLSSLRELIPTLEPHV
jgi:phosphonatase-like hydrolase